MTPENLPVLTEIGSFQHRKELANCVGGLEVCGYRGSSFTPKAFSVLVFHIQLLSSQRLLHPAWY